MKEKKTKSIIPTPKKSVIKPDNKSGVYKQTDMLEMQLLQHLNIVKKVIKMKELAKAINISHSRLTHLMDNLEVKKLIARRPSDEDRRCWFAEITEDGEKLVNNIKSN